MQNSYQNASNASYSNNGNQPEETKRKSPFEEILAERNKNSAGNSGDTRRSPLDEILAGRDKPVNKANSLADGKKPAMSSLDHEKKSKSDLIYLVKGIDAGRKAWYYVLVERIKLQLFLKALTEEIIHLENYGVILYSAYGEEPPQNITDSLKEEYGIED